MVGTVVQRNRPAFVCSIRRPSFSATDGPLIGRLRRELTGSTQELLEALPPLYDDVDAQRRVYGVNRKKWVLICPRRLILCQVWGKYYNLEYPVDWFLEVLLTESVTAPFLQKVVIRVKAYW